jgi:hypothetical protein
LLVCCKFKFKNSSMIRWVGDLVREAVGNCLLGANCGLKVVKNGNLMDSYVSLRKTTQMLRVIMIPRVGDLVRDAVGNCLLASN